MPKRVEIGPVLAVVGALLLLVSLFVAWFGVETGWAVFEVLDLVLAAVAIAALLAAAAALTAGAAGGWGDSRWLPALGLLALVVVAAQLLEPPPGADGATGSGAWLALAGSAVLLVGGMLEAAPVSVSVQVREGARRGRVSAVDRRTPEPPTDDPADGEPTRVPAVDRRSSGSLFGAGAARADDDDDDQRTQPFSTEERPAP